MRTTTAASIAHDELFSAEEIARAAGISTSRVVGLLGGRQFAARPKAIRLLHGLTSPSRTGGRNRPPLTTLPNVRRRQGVPLFLSGALHACMVLALILITSGFFEASETEQLIPDPPQPVRLVFLMTPGPGGGGGGGGMKVSLPPARAERKAPPKAVRKLSSPVPKVRKTPPSRPVVPDPPKPIEPPKVEPPRIEPPKVEPPKVEPPKPEPPKPAQQVVQAPLVPSPADDANKPGVLNQPPSPIPSAGPGAGGGVGTGAGTGIGEGRGAGLGPGSGGGTGGGPFQPGAGILPPGLLREVKPLYTDEARRASIEGDVVLEVVVRRDGTVGPVRLLRKLGAGLDERALDAVRQWKFSPARRQGAPVDVVVEVAVNFSLR